MAFKSTLIALTGSDQDIFEFPATYDGGALLFLVNGESATRDVTVKFYKQSTGVTTTLGVFTVAIGTAWQFPVKFGMEAGDKIIASCASSGVTAYATVIVGGATPPGNAFTGRGAWSSAANYVVNDIVSLGRNSYLALADNTNDAPPSANWMLLAQGGDDGADGVDGDDGAPGAPGEVSSTGTFTAGRLAAFADGTGDVIEDSGKSVADFATAAQGALADTALQPADVGTAAAEDVGYFATAAQGALADTALQPADVGTAAALDADTDTTLAADSDLKIATQKAVKAFVAASIAALLDSAPGTLDTLNELAAALGDDPNFATTVTNALANKQPLNALLTTLVGLTLSNDDFLQVKGGTIANRTVAQVITDLIAGNLFDTRDITTPTIKNGYIEENYAFNSGTTTALDLANGTAQTVTLTDNWNPSSWPAATAGMGFVLYVKQDATGGRTITWPASVAFPGGVAPTITATASKADKLAFQVFDGKWRGHVVGQNY